MPRRALTEDEKEVVRRQVVNHFLKVSRQRGVGAATVREVAEATGRSAMSLYTYFEDRQSICLAAAAVAAGEGDTVMETALIYESVREIPPDQWPEDFVSRITPPPPEAA